MEHFGPRENSLVKVDHLQRWSSDRSVPRGGGSTPIHYLSGYVPPNGVVILKLLI